MEAALGLGADAVEFLDEKFRTANGTAKDFGKGFADVSKQINLINADPIAKVTNELNGNLDKLMKVREQYQQYINDGIKGRQELNDAINKIETDEINRRKKIKKDTSKDSKESATQEIDNWKKKRDEAKKYSTLTDFQKGNPSADYTARKKGKDFFDDITSHMIRKKRNKWTDDELKQEALKYGYLGDFRNNSKAYNIALKRGKDFFNDITSHMKRKLKDWSNDELRDEALKYQTKPDFMKGNPKAYQTAMNRGKEFWDEITSHMPDLHRSWTDDTLRQEALKYKTRGEFMKKASSAYNISRYRSILNDVCDHMCPSGNAYKRCIYTCEFEDGAIYVGLTFSVRQRSVTRSVDTRDAVYQYKEKTGLNYITKQISDFLLRCYQEFIRM
jgi:hypothetical protein